MAVSGTFNGRAVSIRFDDYDGKVVVKDKDHGSIIYSGSPNGFGSVQVVDGHLHVGGGVIELSDDDVAGAESLADAAARFKPPSNTSVGPDLDASARRVENAGLVIGGIAVVAAVLVLVGHFRLPASDRGPDLLSIGWAAVVAAGGIALATVIVAIGDTLKRAR